MPSSAALGFLGSLASLLSLGLTLLVYWNIREIRRAYLYRARVPELLQTLGSHRSALSTFLTNFNESERDFHHQLPLLESTLHALEGKLGWWFSSHRRAVRAVRHLVTKSSTGNATTAEAERLYERLTFLTARLELDRKDREWTV